MKVPSGWAEPEVGKLAQQHRGDRVQADLQRQRRGAALVGRSGWQQVGQAGGQPVVVRVGAAAGVRDHDLDRLGRPADGGPGEQPLQLGQGDGLGAVSRLRPTPYSATEMSPWLARRSFGASSRVRSEATETAPASATRSTSLRSSPRKDWATA